MILNEIKPLFQQAIEFLNKELNTIRTGRASTVMVEDIKVETYGSTMVIKSLANISIPESRQILIEPWDKTVLKDIEKGIQVANIGFNPINDGVALRINLPDMTEEKRKELVKVVGQKCEQTRIEIRKTREEIKNKIKDEKDEDLKNSQLEELDEITKEFNEKVEEARKIKETELMTI